MEFITPQQLVNKRDDTRVILDIRESDTYAQWHILGSINIPVYNDVWNGNFGEVQRKLSALPKDKKMVTVCNAGVTSQHASAVLESMGYTTAVLEGGMMGWNTLHRTVEVINEPALLIKQIIRPGKGCLSYLIASPSTKECFITDPSQFIDEYTSLVQQLGFTIKGVIETHVHADHISGAHALVDTTKTKYLVSGKDFRVNTDFVDLKNSDEIKLGDVVIKIIETPGHTEGSVCLLVNSKALLTGDTLFLEGVGRPDLGRDKEALRKGAQRLYHSLMKLMVFDSELLILPAHTTSTEKVPVTKKLGEVLQTNKTLEITSEEDFVQSIMSNLPMAPPNYEKIKSLNNTYTLIPREIGEKLEFGPNRCAAQ